MANVVHLEVITVEPSESDPDGDGYVLCGNVSAASIRLTHNRQFVTCKNCLRKLASHHKEDKA